MKFRSILFAIIPILTLRAEAQDSFRDPAGPHANFELASRWTPAKVNNKLVFSSSVNPNWFESGDRFWYPYATSQGERWILVDVKAKKKTPLFDTAYMAAQLSSIVRIPYDSAHLPILNVKLIKKDTTLQFELNVPAETKIPSVVEKSTDKETAATTTQGEGQQRSGRRGGFPPTANAAPAT